MATNKRNQASHQDRRDTGILEEEQVSVALRLQQRVTRLFLCFGGVMLFGLLAVVVVMGARVYLQKGETPANPVKVTGEKVFHIPSGSQVLSAVQNGTSLSITLESENGVTVLVLDLKSMKVINKLELVRKTDGD